MTNEASGPVRPIDILLVEDNPGDVRLTRECFKEAKVRTVLHVVNDGEEAFEFLNRRGRFAGAPRPDLVLLDLNMPRMDGREFLARFKQEERFKRIPVVVLTISKAEEDVRTSYGLHANCYIVKPIDFDRFLSVARAVEEFWLTVARLPRGAS